MNTIKHRFIELAIEAKVLKFGSFTLKSGRISPYFFNAGLFYDGPAIQKLGIYYAKALLASKIKPQHLFGPAYKGIPLATTTAVALAEKGIHATVTFNRKEQKTHGEGGVLIGAPLTGETVIIDDVITAGTAFREAQTLINENGGKLSTVLIALDRCELGQGNISAIKEIQHQGIKVISLINFFDLIDYLKIKGEEQKISEMQTYHQQYGCR